MLIPYMISAGVIALFAYTLYNFVIPKATAVRLDFEEKYIQSHPVNFNRKNIHRQIEPGTFIYMESYSNYSKTGYNFSMEKFKDGKLVSKLMADQIAWDSTNNDWMIRRYYIRDINGMHETITEGNTLDTVINMYPADFSRRLNVVESMSKHELNEFIKIAKMQGETNVTAYLIEKYRRTAFPFSTFILTLIGVAVSSRKVRGGSACSWVSGLASVSPISFLCSSLPSFQSVEPCLPCLPSGSRISFLHLWLCYCIRWRRNKRTFPNLKQLAIEK